MTIGVGILGAGPVVQAIHLPTLARLAEKFEVRHIMDVDPTIASSVASRVGAHSSTSLEDLLADDGVEVVAVCSPGQFHADQVIAAMHAGKRAIVCEKPLAESGEDANRIAEASAETGVPVVVGAMHTYDPGWVAATDAWGDLPERAHTIRSRIVIPPNERFEDFATEIITRPQLPTPDLSDPMVQAGMLRMIVLGLAIHDLPLVRRFLPAWAEVGVVSADLLPPFGYAIDATAGGRLLQLVGGVGAPWEPAWTFEAHADDTSLVVTMPPSYVHSGSTIASLTTSDGTRVFGPFAHNGYEGEWRALHELLTKGSNRLIPPMTHLIDDLGFALDISGSAAGVLAGKGLSR